MYHVGLIKESYQIPGFWQVNNLERLLTMQIANYIHIGLNKFYVHPHIGDDILWNFEELYKLNKGLYDWFKNYLKSLGILIREDVADSPLDGLLNGIEVSWNV